MRFPVWAVRILFVVSSAFVALLIGRASGFPDLSDLRMWDYILMLIGAIAASLVVLLDVLFEKKSLAVVVAISLGLVVGSLLELLVRYTLTIALQPAEQILRPGLELAVLLFFCYIITTVILQTKEDFRLVIPYVKFSPEGAGARPMILDTSVIIDGRIADICETGLVDNPLIVPRFVLNELQSIADSSDRLKRARGRRGLDILNRLQKNPRVTVDIRDLPSETHESVDEKLVKLAKSLGGHAVTNDFNLSKIAQLQGVDVVNVNDLARALRPVVLPGEEMEVKVIRPGEAAGQGVGYLDDGTMVVVEQGRDFIGEKITVVVNNVYQTSAGRMIFVKPAAAKNAAPAAPPKPSGPAAKP